MCSPRNILATIRRTRRRLADNQLLTFAKTDLASVWPNIFMFRAAITASIISIIVLGSYPTLTDAASQSTTQLQITSPASNAIVHPGQTLAITVVSPSNTGFSNVAVIGEDPVGFSNVANSLPAQVSLAIPANIACRRYMLTAVGST